MPHLNPYTGSKTLKQMLPEELENKRPENMTDAELLESIRLLEDYRNYLYDRQGKYEMEIFYRKNPECRPQEVKEVKQ
jgi:hypothetical protein